MIASKALITPLSEATITPERMGRKKYNPRNEWGGKANPRKEWAGKARIRLTEMSPYDMNLLKNVAHK